MRFATTYLNSLDFQTWLNFSPNAQRRVLVLLFGGLGVGWGWDVFARRCFSVRNRPQPSAAARNRSQPFATVRNRRQHDRGGDPMAVPMGSAAKMVTLLWRFQTSCSVVSCGTRGTSYALRGIPTCFIMCQKSFCVTGAILLHRFQKMTFMFRGRRSTLDVPIFILRGRRSTL